MQPSTTPRALVKPRCIEPLQPFRRCEPDEAVALVGPSRAGQNHSVSTAAALVRDVARLCHVLLDGVSVKVLALQTSCARAVIGIVPQDSVVFSNLGAWRTSAMARPQATDARGDGCGTKPPIAHDFIMALPGGCADLLMGERGVRL
ncbi:MAG: hypothetical protein U5L74_03615 [Ideonella sp.]|nr:hypothetical protein [Ideonella sp.]